ncbi:MAG: hypothetical protein AAGA19_17450 [Pseudomonadota bacterium]
MTDVLPFVGSPDLRFQGCPALACSPIPGLVIGDVVAIIFPLTPPGIKDFTVFVET